MTFTEPSIYQTKDDPYDVFNVNNSNSKVGFLTIYNADHSFEGTSVFVHFVVRVINHDYDEEFETTFNFKIDYFADYCESQL